MVKWKHVEKQLYHKSWPIIIIKYPSKPRKYRHELVDEPKQQPEILKVFFFLRLSNQSNNGLWNNNNT